MIADFLATFRASPDFIKALWLLIPPVFAITVLALILKRTRRAMPEAKVVDALKQIEILPLAEPPLRLERVNEFKLQEITRDIYKDQGEHLAVSPAQK